MDKPTPTLPAPTPEQMASVLRDVDRRIKSLMACQGYAEDGLATWIGPDFHAIRTAIKALKLPLTPHGKAGHDNG